jgi:transcriptional regulator with XRE-family HTH domain
MAQTVPNLKDRRQRRELSLRAAAAEMGIAHSVLHRAERGVGTLSLPNAVRIADYYGLAVADLLSDERKAA